MHALQDAIKVEQKSAGTLQIPNWDPQSQAKVRDALKVLGSTLPDSDRMFGSKAEVDPVRHLIGAAVGWGGNPRSAAIYLIGQPKAGDGTQVEKLTVKDVPVDGFWSISVYDAQGFFQKNSLNAYSINNLTAKPGKDGAVTVSSAAARRRRRTACRSPKAGTTPFGSTARRRRCSTASGSSPNPSR